MEEFVIHGLFVVEEKQLLPFSILFMIPSVDPPVSTGSNPVLMPMKMKKDGID